jgi:hypothetical protein
MPLPRVALTIRTADRAPHPNYVGHTVRRLVAQSVEPAALHVCATAPDVRWLDRALEGVAVTRHVPDRKLSPNENGLAQIAAVDAASADWILLLEDDLAFCADFVGSVQRWLVAHARPDRHVHQFFGFAMPPAARPPVYDVSLLKLRASQAIALRLSDALDFAAWGAAHLQTWRRRTPWGSTSGDPRIAFDKFIAAWALTRWPGQPGLMSHPHFVKHVGLRSSIHGATMRNDAGFGGEAWAYPPLDPARTEAQA